MKLLALAGFEHIAEFSLDYTRRDVTCGWVGYGFPCNEEGSVLFEKLTPLAKDNLNYCNAHPEEFHAPVVRDYSRHVRVCAVGECDACGAPVQLEGFTNTCDCGADFEDQDMARRVWAALESALSSYRDLRGDARAFAKYALEHDNPTN